MVKVQKVGGVVGWIISIVWLVFLILLITNYAHKSAFVRLIHTILLPFYDFDLSHCKYFGIAFCVMSFLASQAFGHGIRNNEKHFTLWSMIWFSFVLSFLLICVIFGIAINLQEEHPELIVILIVSIVFFGHLYIIAYASFKSIKDEIHRTPILERQSDSSYSVPLRSLRESNSVQTTVLSDYGYRSDDGNTEPPMFCISPVPTAPIEDGYESNRPINSIHGEIPKYSHISNENRSVDEKNCEPYHRIELSDCNILMDDPNRANMPFSYSQFNYELSHNKPEHTHTAEHSQHTSGSNSAPSHQSHNL